jgi:subtilisin family serine protease
MEQSMKSRNIVVPWKLVVYGFAAAAIACGDNPLSTGSGSSQAPASLVDVVAAPAGQAVPDEYIVVFKDNVSAPASEAGDIVLRDGGRLKYTYSSALKGFTAQLSPTTIQALRSNSKVARIEQNQRVHLETTQLNPANFGLDRIDQRNLPLSNSYTFNRTGAGVHFYGIDTGINLTHVDLNGRVGVGFDAVTPGGNANDCNGHGTHTATTAAGTSFGVAKGAIVHPVRVLDCTGSGTVAGVIAGVDFVTQNHVNPAVANMSLGGGISTALDQAVTASIASGVVYAIAAGNNSGNACNTSPARVPAALTVAASTRTDARASFSNFGTCVDLFAPGVGITAGWIGSNTATMTISGTSMATPHVAGVALLLREANPTATPAQVASLITSNATAGKITSAGTGTPNKLLFMGFITGPGAGANQPPTAKFTASCGANHTCTFDASGSTDDVGVVGFQWKRPSGAIIGNTKVITFAFGTGGSKTITLTVTDGSGLTGTVTKTINVP